MTSILVDSDTTPNTPWEVISRANTMNVVVFTLDDLQNHGPSVVDAPIVVYHGNCPDGVASAILMNNMLRPDSPPDSPPCYLHAMQYDDPPLAIHLLQGRTIYFVDFCPSMEHLAQVYLPAAKKIVIVDHHKDRVEELLEFIEHCSVAKAKIEPYVDLEHSGAMLTLHMLVDRYTENSTEYNDSWQAPGWVQYVEDRDLWTWSLEYTKAFSAGMRVIPLTVPAWASHLDSNSVGTIIKTGEAVLDVLAEQITTHVKQAAIRTEPDGTRYALVEAPSYHASELGAAIIQEHKVDYAIVASVDLANNSAKLSFRSSSPVINVAKRARLLGGGGHLAAAGAKVSLYHYSEMFWDKGYDRILKGANEDAS